MTTPIVDPRQFPIGPWTAPETFTFAEKETLLAQLRHLPNEYRALTANLTDADLARTYRPGSWTIRQLVHHVADTHQWHYFRIKHALTLPDTQPGILSTMNHWANQPDGHDAPIEASLAILTGLHHRLAYLLERLPDADWQRAYYHSFRQINVPLPQALDMVVWHATHHLAHIKLALA